MGSPRVASSAPAREVSAYKLFAPPVYKGAIARDALLNRIFIRNGARVVLFFDEFQSLTNKPVLTFFRDLLDRVPENAMIVIGSRSTPEVGLARLVVNNQALIFSADDLRFSPGEVAQFFSEARELGVSQ